VHSNSPDEAGHATENDTIAILARARPTVARRWPVRCFELCSMRVIVGPNSAAEKKLSSTPFTSAP
jgi:hypothetical protein